ncbi:unnamed protein product [Adineta steineri]|uniref:RING-type E3 ubiquitin transferase n=1 Tax=Adineta steineri TaxID=433720 RepID=A0A818G742_9BILA|nr:unnamed protein product [Adineta steineri]CAF3487191.1 unnamed protein product [Adineta steineri]
MPQIIIMKAQYLILLSFLLTFIVITNAFYTKRQFYSSVIYLTKSNTSLAVLYVQGFVFIILFGKLFQRIFLGQLRAIETEHLYERAWFSITETCLAFTMFRDDFNTRFAILFAILLFLKCFHWLLEDRVDYMEQSPVLGPIFHARTIGLWTVLCLCDYLFILLAYIHVMSTGASVEIVFGFEYAILLISMITIALKYSVHLIEIHTGEQWEGRGVYMLFSDVVLGFFRVTLYMIFIMVMMKIHTFPLFAIRPAFLAMRTFRKACDDAIESRRAIQNLNTMYPNLTADELANVVDTTCTICREEMQVQQCIKRLTCQHVFHKKCLRAWFQRQQNCPICRTTVLRSTPRQNAGPQPQVPVPPAELVPPPPATPTLISNSTTTENITIPQIPFSPFAMVLPPFAFPPPPLPPLDFTGMSEEAIRAMEKTELAHVQARLQCLQNVRNLLDASITSMQQFVNILPVPTTSSNNHVD